MDTNAPPAAPPPPPPQPPRPPSRPHDLRRDRVHGMLGGICAGIARTYGIDVTVVRAVWVLAAIAGIGVPAYVIAWIAIPPTDAPHDDAHRARDPWMVAGLVLLAIGGAIAADRLLPHGNPFNHYGWPLLLIGGGLAILVFRRRDERDDGERSDEGPGAHDEPDSHGHGRPPSALPTSPAVVDTAGLETVSAETASAGHEDHDGATTAVPPSSWTQTAPWPSPPSAGALRREARIRRRSQRPRPFLAPVTLSLLLIGAGVASLLQATGAIDVNVTVLLGIATGVVGAALVCSAFAGRAYALILVGVLLAGATAVSSTIDVPLRGGIGHRIYGPVTAADVRGRYELGIGNLEIDLQRVPFGSGTTRVEGRLGIGELLVKVPSTVRVEVTAHAGAGSVMLFGHDAGGWPEDERRAIDGTGAGVLQLDLRVGAGQVRVRRFEPGGIETVVGGS